MIREQGYEDKKCFVYCGPERCNCQAGSIVGTFPQDIMEELFPEQRNRQKHREDVEQKDKEHQYDRAMEILDKDDKPKDVV